MMIMLLPIPHEQEGKDINSQKRAMQYLQYLTSILEWSNYYPNQSNNIPNN